MFPFVVMLATQPSLEMSSIPKVVRYYIGVNGLMFNGLMLLTLATKHVECSMVRYIIMVVVFIMDHNDIRLLTYKICHTQNDSCYLLSFYDTSTRID